MKRFIFATLLVLTISTFAVMPAFAADTCDHDMGAHEPTVASLTAHVQHANEMGHVKTALMPALVAPLDVAVDESLPIASRVGALQAFINLVNAQAGKGIHAECAMHLTMQAQMVIDSLNGQM